MWVFPIILFPAPGTVWSGVGPSSLFAEYMDMGPSLETWFNLWYLKVLTLPPRGCFYLPVKWELCLSHRVVLKNDLDNGNEGFCRLHSIRVDCDFWFCWFIIILEQMWSGLKKREIKFIVGPKGRLLLFFYSLSSFSESPFTVLPSQPILSKGSDTNHLHLNVSLNTGNICILNTISDWRTKGFVYF